MSPTASGTESGSVSGSNVEIVITGRTRSRQDLCPDVPQSKFEHAVWKKKIIKSIFSVFPPESIFFLFSPYQNNYLKISMLPKKIAFFTIYSK